MARDYRYGHKSSAPTPRRTQLTEASHSSDSNEPSKSVKKPFTSLMRKRTKTPNAENSAASVKSSAENLVASHDSSRSREKALSTFRESKTDHSSTKNNPIDDDVQKVKNKVYRESLPKHIRKELEAQEALAKAQAEQAERDRMALEQAHREKRRHRLSLGAWVSIAGVTLMGFAWLLYAPFFLAFSMEMGWVSEETRNRLDPAASVRSELASKAIEATKKPEVSVKPVENPPNAVQYTFYGELPKDVVLAGVQPLGVKTKAPVYLQLLSVPSEGQAQSERRRLAQKGYVVQMATLSGKSGNSYVLRMGPYDDQRTLNRLKVELQKLGLDAHEVSLASVIKASEPKKVVATPTAATQPNNSRGAVAPR